VDNLTLQAKEEELEAEIYLLAKIMGLAKGGPGAEGCKQLGDLEPMRWIPILFCSQSGTLHMFNSILHVEFFYFLPLLFYIAML